MKTILRLFDVMKGITDHTISIDDAAKFLNSEECKRLISGILQDFDSEKFVITENDLEIAENIVKLAWYIYTYSDYDTGLTDTEYDKLYDVLTFNGRKDFITLPNLNKENISHHTYPVLRGSLSKVHYLETPEEKINKSRKTLDNWIVSTERIYFERTGRKINLKNVDVYGFPKWDGVSIIFEFDSDGNLLRALTRGYTRFNTAEDVTHHFTGMVRKIDSGKPYGLKTEVMVEESSVLEYNQNYSKNYAQSRSIASGIINSDEPDERDKYLVVVQLRYVEEGDEIEKLSPEVFNHPYIKCKLGDYETIERFAQEHRFVEGLRCDGMVLHIIDPEIQKVLGRENDKNRFEVAYKFTEEYAYSEVKDIEFQVGLLGRITPVVKIKPIKLKGNKISSASLSNIKRLRELNLAKGDKIKILYDIIPYATIDGSCEADRSGNEPIRPKQICSTCGSKLVEQGDFLYCQNPDCDCRIKGRILNYLSKMRIQTMSYSTIDALYDAGIIKDIDDLYKLEKHKDTIVEMDGFGLQKYAGWIYQIDNNRRVSDAVFLGSLGIPGVSERNFSKILTYYNIDDIIRIAKESDIKSLVDIKGIGEKKAKTIITGLNQNLKLIKFLRNELQLYHEDESSFKFRVCFTKVRDAEMEDLIQSLGGKVVDTVNDKTTYLVVPNMSISSSKMSKAKDIGCQVITIDKLRAELIERFGS